MKRLKNIFSLNKSKDDFNIDQILNQHELNFSDINFESEKSDIIKSFNAINKKLQKSPSLLKNIAAIFPEINVNPILKPLYTIVLTSIVIFSVVQYRNLSKPVQYAEIHVDKGEKINLHVTDNITIYLNSESTIKIPLELKRNSEIILDGEAYFELNQNRNIKILAKGVLFESKNSHFYINTSKEKQLTAQIFMGSANFYNPVLPKSTQLILKTNDKLTYNRDSEFISVENDDNKNVIAWHTGQLNFNDKSLSSVINEISAYFEIPMEIQNSELSSLNYTANFNNLEIDNILDKIQLTFSCNITTDGSKIIIN